jgi:carbamoyl-phosphate synthase large subunit
MVLAERGRSLRAIGRNRHVPKRTDIHTILIIGSGPIVIGQGCEFDYSGTQACKALREEGYRIALINSNPATIMTDPEFADRTYIEPITPQAVGKILEAESKTAYPIDALLPTIGGQTGLNTAVAAYDMGILDKFGVEMIGATREVIHRAEDRIAFKDICLSIGLDVPRSGIAHTMDDARKVAQEVGLPVCIRPAYTLGGTGGGFAFNRQELEEIAARGLEYSPISEILIEESVRGWKEYELEVMRDKADNVVIVCSIENFDPMGVHTGDSITVAPAQTLTDKEYQLMRDAAIAIIRAVGVETGGSNIQFAVDPQTGRMIVVEMNPRVSRSSALASKATGFPIAKIAAKLAVGYTLDEIPNDITRKTPACFEPTIDYCVVKIPRWTFEKFPDADETLTTQMKSVGEAMAIGRTFKEALQKGIRSMEVKRFGLGLDYYDKWLKSVRRGAGILPASAAAVSAAENPKGAKGDKPVQKAGQVPEEGPPYPIDDGKLRRKLSIPCQGRPYYIRYAFKMGWTIEQVFDLTQVDPWFLRNMKELVEFEEELISAGSLDAASLGTIRQAKEWGYSDVQLATIWNTTPGAIRKRREELGIIPVYKLVDTCAAEFEAETPYYYSTYESPIVRVESEPRRTASLAESGVQEPGEACSNRKSKIGNRESFVDDEVRVTDKQKIVILGGGPNRIGQGIEFDYCCVHAAFAAKEMGFESVMVNSNPETVSTDYDTSDMLFFEPLTHEDVLNICERLNGSPFGTLPQLQDFTGFRKSPVPANEVHPTIADGIQYDLEDTVFTQLEKSVRENKLSPAAVFWAGVGSNERGGGLEDVLRVFDIATKAGEAWIATFKGWSKPRMIDFREEDPQFLSKDAQKLLPSAIERLQHEGLLYGVIVQFGGQTPLNLARGLEEAGVPIIGTSPDSIDMAEDRRRFADVLEELKLRCPEGGTAFSLEQARKVAIKIGYPVLVRPSYVLGGRAMEIVSDQAQLDVYMAKAVDASTVGHNHPILIDRFLDNATEVDVDCIADFGPRRGGVKEANPRAVICGVMEHIEEAGIHSGDSACSLPPYSLPEPIVQEIERQTKLLAQRLRVRGLMNVQFAVKDGAVYILEVNPRASRTVPFVSKATGVPWAKLAAKVMAGASMDDLGVAEPPRPAQTSVKESVFPFTKFPGVDVVLGPEMRSTGEVMGIDMSFPLAFAKSQIAAGTGLPTEGTAFLSVCEADKPYIAEIGRSLADMGFNLVATSGTWRMLQTAGVKATVLPKLTEGRPNIADLITNRQVQLLINTPTSRGPTTDEGKIRAQATLHNIPLITTITGAEASVRAIAALRAGAHDDVPPSDAWGVKPLQEYFPHYEKKK